MGKLTPQEIEFIKYLGALHVPFRRISQIHLRGKISHMTAYRVARGKNVTTSNTQPEGQEPEVDLTRDEISCLLYTSPSPRDRQKSRMPSSA